MLTGGNWGYSWPCPVCGGQNSGANLKCRCCEYKNAEELNTSPECVETMVEYQLIGTRATSLGN